MSSFTDAPYSYAPGSNRLLGPVNLSNNPNYVFNATNAYETDSVRASDSQAYFQLAFNSQNSTGPNVPPSIPALVGAPTATTMTVSFTVAGITGTPYPTMSILYGTTTAPTTSVLAFKVAPNLAIYEATITGLAANTTYYFKSVASNPGGAQVSLVSPGYTTAAGGGTAPSGPPTIPVQYAVATSYSIEVSFDVAGITGTPTPTYSVFYGTDPANLTATEPATLDTGTTYVALVAGLPASTTFYFQSVAHNGVDPAATSAVSVGIATTAPAPLASLKTNLVTPFLIQGPRFGQSSPWPALDYYINVDGVGAQYVVGASSASGQQVFAGMYAGTKGVPGNASGDPGNVVPYAGSCIADQAFAWLGGSSGNAQYSDAYLMGSQTNMGTNGRMLACWGGFTSDILGLFGPYQPPGYPAGETNPDATDVVKSFLYNFCGITAGNSNPLNWVRTNSTGTSAYDLYYDGLILDFENVGAGNPQNNYPTPGNTPPTTFTDPKFATYAANLALIPLTYYNIAPALFLGNAPVSLSIVADLGTTNICAANTGLNTWWPFATATIPPTGSSGNNPYNNVASLALNHPTQLQYMDDVFVQFYNEAPDYYIGGKYFANLIACWGLVALAAQSLNKKKTTINIGLARGNIIPGGNAPFVANAQGPTPKLDAPPNPSGSPPYTYWYPQYATASDGPGPNYTDPTNGWPNTGVASDPPNLAAAITAANALIQAATGQPGIVPSDWCSGTGFWAGANATTSAQAVYTKGNPLSPGSVLPHSQTYCWSDASYPSPDPLWKSGSSYNVPIVSTL